jgi:hypothetical protein
MFANTFAKSTLLSLALVAGGVSALSAQERLFEWRGRVDREIQIVMRGGDVWTQDLSGRRTRGAQARVSRSLPSQAGQVRLQLLDGRGDVRVVQQPSNRNGYTTIVRISDRSGGADRYRLAAYWQPLAPGRWGDRVDNEDDGRWDRDGRYGDRDGVDGMLRWRGAVDDEVEIRIQGRNFDTRTLSGNGARDVRANISGRALRREQQVRVRERQGRGSVIVVQQPSQWNNYTAVIRVRDRQGGFGHYDFEVIW